ncbi:hypothetical protein C8R45DRAFT_1103607 [Mycena sanguinolenta]|nr:hypothetical protein C8R45DRAFT_1103607 [Mycena sanguinolenta]
MLLDENARFPRRVPKDIKQTFNGQLTHLYRVHSSTPVASLKIHEPTTYIWAGIRACDLKPDEAELRVLDIHFYLGHSLAGRVPVQNNEWALIDRSGALARADWFRKSEED